MKTFYFNIVILPDKPETRVTNLYQVYIFIGLRGEEADKFEKNCIKKPNWYIAGEQKITLWAKYTLFSNNPQGLRTYCPNSGNDIIVRPLNKETFIIPLEIPNWKIYKPFIYVCVAKKNLESDNSQEIYNELIIKDTGVKTARAVIYQSLCKEKFPPLSVPELKGIFYLQHENPDSTFKLFIDRNGFETGFKNKRLLFPTENYKSPLGENARILSNRDRSLDIQALKPVIFDEELQITIKVKFAVWFTKRFIGDVGRKNEILNTVKKLIEKWGESEYKFVWVKRENDYEAWWVKDKRLKKR